MKTLKLGLLPRILIAILLGILLGFVTPEFFVRLMVTFNGIFGAFLGFVIPLIILGLVTTAIAGVGRGAGKMLLLTVLMAYGSTAFAGFVAYFTGSSVFPHLIEASSGGSSAMADSEVQPFFNIAIPPLIDVMSALVLSFIMGLGIALLPNMATLGNAAREFGEVVKWVIAKIILPVLPFYIFGIFFNMTYCGGVASVIMTFIKIIGVIFVVHIFLLLLYFSIAGLVARKNPLKMLLTMLPAYFTALGTQSSAATIPVTLDQTKKLGVRSEVAGFVVPLCATIHMPGSCLKIVSCSLAIMIMNGMPYDFTLFAGFILLLGITMVAAPGVPGGCVMAALSVLQAVLGFDEQAQAVVIAIYIAIDNFGTACNVTGDGAVATIIDKIMLRGERKD